MAKFFKPEQDAIIMSVGKEALAEGTPLRVAFLNISDEMQRDVDSVYGRYKRLSKALKEGKVGATTALSESDRIILKLKTLSREKVRNAEKVDLYKDKFIALQKEHDDLKRNFRKLQVEHQTLIDAVNKAIGEDLDFGGNASEAG